MALEIAKEALEAIGEIGCDKNHPEKGRNCLPFSENENLSIQKLLDYADLLKEQAEQKGLKVTSFLDAFGNAHITLEGESERKVVIVSHVDSVPRGGRYDGIVGVTGGLAVIEHFISENIKPKKSVRVIAFRAEESSATKQACLGSLLATGTITYEELENLNYEEEGKASIPLLKHISQKTGLSEKEIKKALQNPSIQLDEIDGALELHIEQSRILERLNKPIGVVTGGIGSASRKEIYIKEERQKITGKRLVKEYEGVANHSGGTPMNGEVIKVDKDTQETLNLRQDALVQAMKEFGRRNGLFLVKIQIPEGSCNTIPGQCIAEFVEENIGGNEVECISNNVAEAVKNIILGTETIAEKLARQTNGLVRATIGNVTHENGHVILHLDQRMLSEEAGELLINQIQALVDQQTSLNVTINTIQKGKGSPVQFRGNVKHELIKVYRDLFGEDPVQMSSMPGHDLSKIVKKRRDGTHVPGAMIFIRSLNNGLSHNPSEYSSPEDIEKGMLLLCEAVKRLACK